MVFCRQDRSKITLQRIALGGDICHLLQCVISHGLRFWMEGLRISWRTTGDGRSLKKLHYSELSVVLKQFCLSKMTADALYTNLCYSEHLQQSKQQVWKDFWLNWCGQDWDSPEEKFKPFLIQVSSFSNLLHRTSKSARHFVADGKQTHENLFPFYHFPQTERFNSI